MVVEEWAIDSLKAPALKPLRDHLRFKTLLEKYE